MVVRVYDDRITPRIENRFGDNDIEKVETFCESLTQKIKETDPKVIVESRLINHANLDLWYFALSSQTLRDMLGMGYPVDGKNRPDHFAEIHIYLDSVNGGYEVFQRFNFGQGLARMKRLFEVKTGAIYSHYPGALGGEGLISFSEQTTNLNETSFERLVNLYYKTSKLDSKRFYQVKEHS